ncbi:MAG: low molecular weight phosphatase family protein [Actinomycetota bacterium]
MDSEIRPVPPPPVPGRVASIRAIEILMLCTGNTCRSPMAAALLSRRLDEAGVKAVVSSAGLLFDGRPATDHGQAVMADRGIDTSGHRSRKLRAEIVTDADIVIGMARSHVREAVALAPDVWTRAFTLKEIVRRGEERGGRAPGEPVEDWLARLHAGRRLPDLLGESGADDVADPIGGPLKSYERTAAELDDLTARLARLLGSEPAS